MNIILVLLKHWYISQYIDINGWYLKHWNMNINMNEAITKKESGEIFLPASLEDFLERP